MKFKVNDVSRRTCEQFAARRKAEGCKDVNIQEVKFHGKA